MSHWETDEALKISTHHVPLGKSYKQNTTPKCGFIYNWIKKDEM
jgi:hypothetical protein